MKILFVGKPSNLYTDLYNQLSVYFSVKTMIFDNSEVYERIKEWKADMVLISLKDATKEELVLADLLKLDSQWKDLKVVVIGFSFEVNNYEKNARLKADRVLAYPIPNYRLIEEICEVGDTENPLKSGNTLHLREPKRQKHVLVVDDDPRMLRAVKTWLEDTYKVSIVNSGEAAISFLGKQIPDVIILDYEMPEHNGPETLGVIRQKEHLKDLPVFILTGVSEKEKVKIAASLKPEGYILKGISREKLLMRINDYFATHED